MPPLHQDIPTELYASTWIINQRDSARRRDGMGSPNFMGELGSGLSSLEVKEFGPLAGKQRGDLHMDLF